MININRSEYKRELENRTSASSRVAIGSYIQRYNHKKLNQLYFMPTLKMLNLIERVSNKETVMRGLFKDLPTVAQTAFKRGLIINELQSTSEIEGVSSTKVEIANSLRIVEGKGNEKKSRFKNMVVSYLNIFNGKVTLPRTPADIRTIYEQIVSDEINNEDGLDGGIFRNEGVQMVTASQ